MVITPAPQPATAQAFAAGLPADQHGQPIDLESARRQLEPLAAEQRLAWAREHLAQRFALTTSFGIQASWAVAAVSGCR